MIFLPEIVKINKTNDSAKYKLLEDAWGRSVMKQIRPDLKLDKQWTNLFGEQIVKEIYILLGHEISKTVKMFNYLPDIMTDDAVLEVKTGTYHTSGTASEKILGCPFKYAEIPRLYGKPLKIICVGGAEKLCRENYGNLICQEKS